jgi:hypothetical protein
MPVIESWSTCEQEMLAQLCGDFEEVLRHVVVVQSTAPKARDFADELTGLDFPSARVHHLRIASCLAQHRPAVGAHPARAGSQRSA